MEFLQQILQQITPIEWTASLLGAVSVWFVVKRNVLAFPIGIVMVALYIWIFYQAKLYADMSLQVAFILMQVQGWIIWSRSDKADDDRITILRFDAQKWIQTLLFIGIMTPTMGFLLANYTDAHLPYLDSFTAMVSVSAQWWMNKKYLENWYLWIFVDLVYLYQYSVKSLYATVLLYALFTIMATLGLLEWRKNGSCSEGS